MPSKARAIRGVFCSVAVMACSLLVLAPQAVADDQLSIKIDSGGAYLAVTLENSVFKAVIRTHDGGGCDPDQGGPEPPVEHAICDWTIKSLNQNQAQSIVDACAQRGPLKKATVLVDTPAVNTVRLESGCTGIVEIQEVSIFPDSPVIKVHYLQYPSWTNTVDIGSPGGTTDQSKIETRVFGQETFIRALQFYEKSYWNTHDGGEYQNDPADGGSLNYHGHMIMLVGHKSSGVGFGRVMPIKQPGIGGIKILKLLFNRGFETFPATGQAERPAFTGYVFVFTQGLDQAITIGQAIVDGDMLQTNVPPVANAGTDRTLADNDGNGFEMVDLDGSGSSDPDGAIASFSWTESGNPLATGDHPSVSLAVGLHSLVLTVTDNRGATATDSVTIRIDPRPESDADVETHDSDSGPSDETLPADNFVPGDSDAGSGNDLVGGCGCSETTPVASPSGLHGAAVGLREALGLLLLGLGLKRRRRIHTKARGAG